MTARLELQSSTVLYAGLMALAGVVGLLAGMDPKMAIAAALAATFVVLVMASLPAGVAAFAAISFLDVLPVGGAPSSLAKVAGALLALSWLAALSTRPAAEADFLRDHPVVSYAMLALIGWSALSLVWAEDPATGFESVVRLALNLVLLVIVFTAVRTEQHVRWLLYAFLLGATVSAAFGTITTEAGSTSPTDPARLESAGGLDPNELAATLVATLVLAGALALRSSRPLVRAVLLGVMGFAVVGVLLTLSRTGLVSLLVALVAAVVVGGRWRPMATVLLVAVAIGGLGFFAFAATPIERERITTFDGGAGRSDIWVVGWRMVEAHPVEGVGIGNFRVSSIHYLLEPGAIKRDDYIVNQPRVAHNIYLEVLAELGVVGLALFLFIVLFCLRCVLKAVRVAEKAGNASLEVLSRAVFVALTAYLAAGFFLSEQYSKQLWLLLALGPALLAAARALEREEPATPLAGGPVSPPPARDPAGRWPAGAGATPT